MKKILLDICDQLKELKIDSETINNLNYFFNDVNTFLKGDKSTMIYVFNCCSVNILATNLLNDDMDTISYDKFKDLLIEYIKAFSDNKELLFDILELLIDNNIIVLSDYIRLELFNKLFNSGYFCYTPLNPLDFKESWNNIKYDMAIISHIVSLDTIDSINIELEYYLKEFYMLDTQTTLKELIL